MSSAPRRARRALTLGRVLTLGRALTLAGLAATLTVVALARSAPAAADPATADPTAVSVRVGQEFTLDTILPAGTGVQPAVAHLNVVSLTPDVYVDPEDWCDRRTQPVPAGPARLTWPIHAVTAGTFDIYVVFVPTGPAAMARPATPARSLTVSAVTRVTVASQRTINAAGALPTIVAVPTAVAALTGLLRWRRRKRVCAGR